MLNGIRNLFENIRKSRELRAFKDFDKMYEETEYDKLLHRLPTTNLISAILSISVCANSGVKGFTDVICTHDRNRTYRYVSEYFYEEDSFVFSMLFKNPLREMPLYINHPRDEIRVIALWRLSINK